MILGIRPEDFEDASLMNQDMSGQQLQSRVRLIEALRSELLVHFDVNAKTVDSGDPDAVDEGEGAANAVARFSPRSRARMNQDITIAVATENVHFFDIATREAIWAQRTVRPGPPIRPNSITITSNRQQPGSLPPSREAALREAAKRAADHPCNRVPRSSRRRASHRG